MGRNSSTKKKNTQPRFDILFLPYAVIACAVIIFGAILILQQRQFQQTIPDTTYQVVFLTNGQVYIGQLEPLSRSYLQLHYVY